MYGRTESFGSLVGLKETHLKYLMNLHPIVVYTVSESATGRAAVLHPWQLKVNMDFLRNIFNFCNNDIFHIEQLCSIIFLEHRDSSFS